MKLLVVGGGGREHAIVKKLKENPTVTELYVCPGNGGIAKEATCVPIGAKDIGGIVKFAQQRGIDFCVVAPDDPLVLGCVDALEAVGIPCFGPNKAAARLEGSKVFSKNLMQKYGIPTAAYAVFDSPKKALSYVKSQKKFPTVIKADGLALGKGVVIAKTLDEAKAAIQSMMEDKKFGDSGNKIVIEEFLEGPEVSVLSFTDGKTLVPMVSSMDHKRALDGDKGPNTGGMGTVAPNPYYTDEIAKTCMDTIFLPTLEAMQKEGCPFQGCLYFGLMLTKDGPKVIEYNCRFGDPETQVVLPLLKTDLLDIMQAVHDKTLDQLQVEWKDGAAACVILASGGYPAQYRKELPITLGTAETMPDILLYHAGTALQNGKLITAGGRVLGVTATADALEIALQKAYAAAKEIQFDGMFYRKDIGQKALQAKNIL